MKIGFAFAWILQFEVVAYIQRGSDFDVRILINFVIVFALFSTIFSRSALLLKLVKKLRMIYVESESPLS